MEGDFVVKKGLTRITENGICYSCLRFLRFEVRYYIYGHCLCFKCLERFGEWVEKNKREGKDNAGFNRG